MCAPLDELHQQYFALWREGLAPTGLVIEYETFKAIGEAARRDDPRVQWTASGPERLFGFRPQFVLAAPARFTFPEGAIAPRKRDYTLRELRAL